MVVIDCWSHYSSLSSVFRHIPSLAVRDRTVGQLAEEYKSSKHKRPVCGGIILNEKMDKVSAIENCTYSHATCMNYV